jgi:hypothetical protein
MINNTALPVLMKSLLSQTLTRANVEDSHHNKQYGCGHENDV